MDTNTTKLIADQFNKLPANLQQAIHTIPWKSLVQEIGNDSSLTTEQIENLGQETMFVLYGFEAPEDYVANMVRELNVDEEKADAIALAIDEKIFVPLVSTSEGVASPSVPEIAPEIHPTTVPGETAHEVESNKQETINNIQATDVSQPAIDNSKAGRAGYPDGADPYREPIE